MSACLFDGLMGWCQSCCNVGQCNVGFGALALGDRDHILISGPSNLNNFLDLPPTCFSLLSFSLQQRWILIGRQASFNAVNRLSDHTDGRARMDGERADIGKRNTRSMFSLL